MRIYAIEAADGVVLVDAGWDRSDGLERLDGSLREIGAGLDAVRGVLFTHWHHDHYALGAALRDATGAWLALHRVEAELIADPPGVDAVAGLDGWFASLGVPGDERADAVEAAVRIWGATPRFGPDRSLDDGSSVEVGGLRLEVMHTPGHSPGHACFVAADRGVVFSGDHVLSQTTPNVGILPWTAGSPLDDYLESLARTRALGGLLALPGHEELVPVGARSEELLEHHREQLAHAESLVAAGEATVNAVARGMPWTTPWDDLGPLDRQLALAEAYAHLAALERRGRLVRVSERPLRWSPPARA